MITFHQVEPNTQRVELSCKYISWLTTTRAETIGMCQPLSLSMHEFGTIMISNGNFLMIIVRNCLVSKWYVVYNFYVPLSM